MADYPYLSGTSPVRTRTDSFSGLDRRDRASAGAVRDGLHLSPDALPALRVCPTDEKVQDLTACTDLLSACGCLIWTSGGNLYVDGVNKGGVRDEKHQMVVLGKRLFLFPEKQYLTLGESGGLQNMEARVVGGATFTDDSLELTTTKGFSVGDGVTIEKCTRYPENNKTAVVREIDGNTLIFSEGCFTAGTESAIIVTRKVPDLAFVCEKDNRLWGVHDNAVCCSVLGDPLNWMVYEGLATDAFEAEVGTDGAFTGIAAASSHVLCFKENCVHKIYGAKPSNFQVQVSSIPGVQAGCERAIRNVGETVYWWARDGLMAYGGGIPDRLSAPLGDAGYTDMCMGEDGHKLWLSGLRDGQPETLIYDIEQAAFLPVDSRKAVQFAYHDGARYLAEETALWKTGTDRKNTDFAAVFGPFRRTAPAVLTGLTILADCVGECTLACAVRTERGDWMPVWASGRLSDGRARIPVPAVRGMQFWLRVTGRGDVTLQSIVRILHPDGPDDL